MMMEYAGYIASLLMGTVLGLMGGGGSILTVPILVYLFALPPTAATGYSLFIVGITALVGSVIYIRKGEVDFQAGVAFALPSVVGVNISRGWIIPAIPSVVTEIAGFALTKEVLIMAAFASLMVVASYSMIRKNKVQGQFRAAASTRMALIAAVGLLVGGVAGFVGAGGGFLIIPALVFMAGLSMRIAVGTSLTIIAVQSLLGFAGDVSRGMPVDWPFLGVIAAFAVTGIAAGSAFAHKIKEQNLKSAFGWSVLAMGISILIEQLYRLST